MKPPNIALSKSQFVKGCQCPKALWFSLYRRDLVPPPDPSQQALFDEGSRVGEWAKRRFPDGVEVTAPFYDTKAGAEATKVFIADGHEVIFEATAVHALDSTHARIDIFCKTPNGWDMVEVKGSTSVKDYHLDDMSFQYHVFTGAGYQVNRCFMMLVDNTYVRQGDIDPQKLFKLVDITEDVLAAQPDIGGRVSGLTATIAQDVEPQEKHGARCFKPFSCDFIPHCWEGIPDYNIYNVLTKDKADEVVETLGSYEVKSLPAHLIPKGVKGIDVQSHLTGQIEVRPDEIRTFLAGLQYPLCYLDYETIGSAIPLFDGMRPFQNAPFQFSLHVQDAPDAELKHHSFLHKEQTDPRPAFIDALIRLCGTQGTVVVYNQGFEEGVNDDLKESFPEHAIALSAINARMADLLVPFKKRWLYHHHQNGSASIKRVLPAFVPELSYDGLNIGNGQDASQKYLDFMRGQSVPPQFWRDLEEYCGLDTFAMVKLAQVLREKIASR